MSMHSSPMPSPWDVHHGAVEGVTGSCHRLQIREDLALLVDGGLFQGLDADHLDSLEQHLSSSLRRPRAGREINCLKRMLSEPRRGVYRLFRAPAPRVATSSAMGRAAVGWPTPTSRTCSIAPVHG